jgi:hypothetical protein
VQLFCFLFDMGPQAKNQNTCENGQ